MGETKKIINPSNRGELKVGNVTFRSFYDHRVTEDDLKQARLELGETEAIKEASLLKLKDMLKSDNDFYYRLDDDYLLRFLRWKKYQVEKTYNTIRNFYVFRKERPDIFALPDKLDYFLSRDILKCLPYREKEGNLIYWIETHEWKLDEMTCTEILITLNAYADIISINPSNQINGVIGIWDVGGLTASHIYQNANFNTIKTFFTCMQTKYPWRFKQVIAINCNLLMRGFFRTFQFLFSKKWTDRFVLLGSDVKELHKYIHPCLLPKVLGGSVETSECRITQLMKDNLPYIKYERSFGPSTS